MKIEDIIYKTALVPFLITIFISLNAGIYLLISIDEIKNNWLNLIIIFFPCFSGLISFLIIFFAKGGMELLKNNKVNIFKNPKYLKLFLLLYLFYAVGFISLNFIIYEITQFPYNKFAIIINGLLVGVFVAYAIVYIRAKLYLEKKKKGI